MHRFSPLILGCLLAGALGVPAGEKEPMRFRVMTYNIHHAEGIDGRVDLDRIAAVIKDSRADLVALQEVDRGVERTFRLDMPRLLAEKTGLEVVFENNFHYQGGEYGNAMLSRFPVVSSTNLHYRMIRSEEQRGLLQVQVKLPSGERLWLLNTHIDFRRDDTERVQNVGELLALPIVKEGGPMVVCGDFNDFPKSRTWEKMREQFEDAWLAAGEGEGFTIPSEGPNRRIDFVFYQGEPLHAVEAEVMETLASDHLPVVVEFEWRAGHE